MALLAALGLAGLAAASAGRPELPPIVRQDLKLNHVGGDELRLFGFRVYHASLWTPSGRYSEAEPRAFSLHYRRGFSRDQLIEITLSTWEKQGTASPDERRAWARELGRVWRDVERDDILTAVVMPGGETRFYDARGLLGRIEDYKFGPAYLGIWLDEQTLLPDLRSALLGFKRAS